MLKQRQILQLIASKCTHAANIIRAIAMPRSAISLDLEPGQKATLQPVTW
ncbi:hypothetical protein [Chroococcidiopsis sp.]